MPTTKIGKPMRANSKNPKGSRPLWASIELMMPLGGVPTRVSVPPRDDAKAIGMSIWLEGIFEAMHMARTMGTATAVVPVFDRTPESAPTASMEKKSSFSLLPCERRMAVSPILSAKPVTNVPSPRMNMAMNRTETPRIASVI